MSAQFEFILYVMSVYTHVSQYIRFLLNSNLLVKVFVTTRICVVSSVVAHYDYLYTSIWLWQITKLFNDFLTSLFEFFQTFINTNSF